MTPSFQKVFAMVWVVQTIFFSTLTAQINGKIVDSKTGKPLNDVDVFINMTTLSTHSDSAGQFSLITPLEGFYNLVLYKPGYYLFQSNMKLTRGHSYSITLSLKPADMKKAVPLTVVEKKELKEILAPDNGSKLVNEDEIRMVKRGIRTLSYQSPLIIRNETTGCLLKYYGAGMPLSEISQSPVLFEYLSSVDMAQNVDWEKNRVSYFNGSLRHWLMAAWSGRLHEEGYSCVDEKGREVDSKTFVFPSPLTGYKKINLTSPLVINFQKKDGTNEKSQLTVNVPVDVNEDGVPINVKALKFEGPIDRDRLGFPLPNDYIFIKGNVEEIFKKGLLRLNEKVYLHTDKPYYYPGESIWFRVYMHYYFQPNRYSLSKTLYVELINPAKQVIMEKVLRLDSGFAANDFRLPDSLAEGNYYMRAYTNLNRNYGDSSLYVKLIPILSLKEAVAQTVGGIHKLRESIAIRFDKKSYHTREKITLTLEMNSKEVTDNSSNISVSVTDANQVIPILDSINILVSNKFDTALNISNWKFGMENGLAIKGRFLNPKGKPEKTNLTIVQSRPETFLYSETDEHGFFSMTGIEFYDTMTFSFQSDKSNNYAYGKIEILSRERPSVIFKLSDYQPVLKPMELAGQMNSWRMLKEVVVKGHRSEKTAEPFNSPYGKADYTLMEKDINISYSNILYSLMGKVPGLSVDPLNNTIFFGRSYGQSITLPPTPLVTIDGATMGGDAGTVLAMINPASVERIDITKRLNVLYGAQGKAGVIAIYLKKGDAAIGASQNFQSVKIIGYSTSHDFPSPDYSVDRESKNIDFRATLYWNPNIKIRSHGVQTSVSFFAADLPGRYRVISEGITDRGVPIRGEAFIEIEKE